MKAVFVDELSDWKNLLPLTYTKPIAQLRIGIRTIQEKWEHYLQLKTEGVISAKHLSSKLSGNETLFINATILPTAELAEEIQLLKTQEVLIQQNKWIAFKGNEFLNKQTATPIVAKSTFATISRPWHLFQLNGNEIRADYSLLTQDKTSEVLSDPHTIAYNPSAIFIEEGASIKAAILNAENGPIYIGKNAKIHEGAIIKGPFAACEGANVVMGSKIRENCTIGVKATGGGELKNTIIGDYSNKGHDGYLGDSVLGNWCNLGALTNVSNLKNTYSTISVWDRNTTSFLSSETNKFGCIIGDYTHTGISTTLNTGTIIEPFCQLFGAGLHPKFVPAFNWGEPNKYTNYQFSKAIEVAKTIKSLKNESFTDLDSEVLKAIYEMVKP